MEEHKTGELEEEEREEIELVLFQVSECYVYLIPPRKTAASYRADEWNVNKWAWEGTLKVVSKGVECIIRLEDKTSGELYAQAFLREGEPHPVEPVIDSSRYFVLRVEENIDGRARHAFIGIGFRERPEAYDFQAALHDHMKYLHKKKAAEEMEQNYQHTSSVDYSLKEGETMVLQLKNVRFLAPLYLVSNIIDRHVEFRVQQKTAGSSKSKFFQPELSVNVNRKSQETVVGLKLPAPPAPPSPVVAAENPSFRVSVPEKDTRKMQSHSENKDIDPADDDFGDFQAA